MLAESHGEIIDKLVLRNVAAHRVGLVLAQVAQASIGERQLGRKGGQSGGIIRRSKQNARPLESADELIDRAALKRVRLIQLTLPFRLRAGRVENRVDHVGIVACTP